MSELLESVAFIFAFDRNACPRRRAFTHSLTRTHFSTIYFLLLWNFTTHEIQYKCFVIVVVLSSIGNFFRWRRKKKSVQTIRLFHLRLVFMYVSREVNKNHTAKQSMSSTQITLNSRLKFFLLHSYTLNSFSVLFKWMIQ